MRSRRKGTLVIVGGETGGRWLGGNDRQLRAIVLSRFVSQKLRRSSSSENTEDLLVLNELIEAGKLAPVIDRTYPLREAAEAIRYVEDGHARGKVVDHGLASRQRRCSTMRCESQIASPPSTSERHAVLPGQRADLAAVAPAPRHARPPRPRSRGAELARDAPARAQPVRRVRQR